MVKIAYNVPYLTGKETDYIRQSVQSGNISGDSIFTKKCHELFEKKYNFKKCLLTTSCTDALEMAAILLDIKPGDEIIAPSYTFVSTVNPFILRGAKIVFIDSAKENPNLNVASIEGAITLKTKAIVVVHYAGIACDMDKIMAIAKKHKLFVVEDAAQAIDSYYNGKPLGSFGQLSTFSFHETKNIISGEGGMLVINDEKYIKRAEIIREKGTNRSAFFRGEIDKYGWVDIGSSFLPSDIIAAFLFAQLENIEKIQKRRKEIWEHYFTALSELQNFGIQLPFIPKFATNNGHIFYLVCKSVNERAELITYLREKGIYAVFHYQSLHKSEFYRKTTQTIPDLPQADRYTDCLLRLPLYYELENSQVDYIVEHIKLFFTKNNSPI